MRIKQAGCVFILCQCFSMFFCTLHAATLYVPAEYPTIQEAIDAANENDIVSIADGTYTGPGNTNLSLNKNITIQSTNGPEKTVIDCEGSGRGAVISDGIFSGLTVTNCIALFGGGIYAAGSSIIDDCVITENTASGSGLAGGGGVFLGGSATLGNSIVSNNIAPYGGGVASSLATSPTIINSTISNNHLTGDSRGGGVYIDNTSSFTVTHSTISDNSGDGIDFWESTVLHVDHSSFVNNGNGIKCYDHLYVDSSTFIEHSGSGIMADQFCVATITNSMFRNNNGSGIDLTSRAAFTTIDSSFIMENKANGITWKSHAEMTNSIVSDNTGNAGIDMAFKGGLIANSVIANNVGSWSWPHEGSGISAEFLGDYGVPLVLKNNIVWGNTGRGGQIAGSYITTTYSIVQGGYSGEGNIDADPLFYNAEGGDYYLASSSPAIDSGTSTDTPAVDIDGISRPQGLAYDIGAYEYHVLAPTDLSIALTDLPDPVIVSSDLTYTTTVTNKGPDRAGNVTLTDTLPSSVVFSSVTSSQGSCLESGGTVTCELGEMLKGADATVTIIAMPTLTDTISNTVVGTNGVGDPVSENDSATEATTVEPLEDARADLSISKADNIDPANRGSELTYTVSVTNHGPSEALDVVVTDTLPQGLTLISTSGCQEDPDGVPTCALGTVLAGTTGQYTVVTSVGHDATDLITNEVSVSSLTPEGHPGEEQVLEQTGIIGTAFGDEHIITTAAIKATAVYAADLDDDADLDVLSASYGDNKIAWYANNGIGDFGVQQVISTGGAANGAYSVYSADLDADGDLDVLSASVGDNRVAWYVNDGAGNFGAQQVISNSLYARSVYASDLDGDGDLDVLSASTGDDKISWYANDGAGNFSAEHVVTLAADGALAVYAADLDGDGDQDILSASYNDDKIAWYANDGSGNFGAQQIITTADGAGSIYAADLDGDDDLDVLFAASGDTTNKVAWHPNDGSGSFGAQQVITGQAKAGANWVYAADLDNDGDLDVLWSGNSSYSEVGDRIAWHINDGSGNFGASQTIGSSNKGFKNVYAGDLDGDGDIDVLSASYYDNKIAWYPNEYIDNLPTTTTIDSDNPDPSVTGETITVAFSVSGGSPTGNVTVTADTGESCMGALSSGVASCTLELDTAGLRNLTAEYAGDTGHRGSTSDVESHQVDDDSICESGPMVIDAVTFVTGEHARASEHSITTQGDVQIQSLADVTFRAPILGFRPGFRVAASASFHVRSEAVICTETASVQPPTTTTATPTIGVSGIESAWEPLSGPEYFARLQRLPRWVRTELAAHGVDLGTARHALLDSREQWLIFETTQDLTNADRNGVGDIYRLDLLAETLSLISSNPEGAAGGGSSVYPATDALGEWVVFQSDADDLVEDDRNGVSDIFLRDIALGATRRITETAAEASQHPALDAAGEDLVYDRLSEDGHRYILSENLHGSAGADLISLEEDAGALSDSHHPAISADARFVAYIDEQDGNADRSCYVHLYDRDSGRYQRWPCPSDLAAASEITWPQFGYDGRQVWWYLPGADDWVVTLNPLLDAYLTGEDTEE